MKDGEENELSRRPEREQKFTFEDACNTLFSTTP